MSRKRTQIKPETLLQARNQFLTNGVLPAEEPVPVEEQPPVQQDLSQESAAQEAEKQEVVSSDEVSPDSEKAVAEEQPESSETEPLSKKRLLQLFLECKENKNDTMYLPPPLYKAVRTVWNKKKADDPGFKKSHLIIEVLLNHPEILAELRKLKVLK